MNPTFKSSNEILKHTGSIISFFISLSFLIAIIYINGFLNGVGVSINSIPIGLSDIFTIAIKLSPYLLVQTILLTIVLLVLEKKYIPEQEITQSYNATREDTESIRDETLKLKKELKSLRLQKKLINVLFILFIVASIIAALILGINDFTVIMLLFSWIALCLFLASWVFWDKNLKIKYGEPILNLILVIIMVSGSFFIIGYKDGLSKITTDKPLLIITKKGTPEKVHLLYSFSSGILLKNANKKIEYAPINEINKMVFESHPKFFK